MYPWVSTGSIENSRNHRESDVNRCIQLEPVDPVETSRNHMKQLFRKILYKIKIQWSHFTGQKYWHTCCDIEVDPISRQSETDEFVVMAKTKTEAIHKAIRRAAIKWCVQDEHVYVFDITETTSPVLLSGE